MVCRDIGSAASIPCDIIRCVQVTFVPVEAGVVTALYVASSVARVVDGILLRHVDVHGAVDGVHAACKSFTADQCVFRIMTFTHAIT